LWLDDRLLLMARDLVSNPGFDRPSLVRLAQLDVPRRIWSVPSDTEILGGGAVEEDLENLASGHFLRLR